MPKSASAKSAPLFTIGYEQCRRSRIVAHVKKRMRVKVEDLILPLF